MADNVEVPVTLSIENIDLSKANVNALDAKLDERFGSLRKTIADIFSADPSTFSKKMTTANSKIISSYQKLTAASDKYNDTLRKAGQSSDEYKNAAKNIEQLENQYRQLSEDIKNFNPNALGEAYRADRESALQNMQKRLAEVAKQYNEAKRILEDPIRLALADKGTPDSMEKVKTAIEGVMFALRNAQTAEQDWAKTQQSEMPKTVENLNKSNKSTNKLVEAGRTLGRAFGAAFKTIQAGATKAVQGFKKVAATIGKVVKAIGTVLSRLKTFGKAGKSTTTDLGTAFKKLKRNILMFGFGFRTAYFAIKRLRKIFFDAFKTMAAQFPELNAQLNTFTMSLNRLKGSLGTMFQPLISVAIPILVTFMEYLSKAMEAVATFFATLTGQRVIYRATSNQEDYANSLHDTANAAREAEKALASYDKLEVIQQDKTSGAGSGSSDLPLNVTYEQIPVESAISDFAQRIKEAWAKQDFTEIGEIVTQKILSVLDRIQNSVIPKVTGFINTLANVIVTFVNGADFTAIGGKVGQIINDIVSQLNPTRIGQALASIYNMFIRFVDGLVTDIDWANLGVTIANGIHGFFTELDIESAVHSAYTAINGFADLITNTFDNLDIEGAMTRIADNFNNFVDNLDIDKISSALAAIPNALTEALYTIVTKTNWSNLGKKLGQLISNMVKKINWDKIARTVVNAIAGIVQFIFAFIKNIDLNAVWKSISDTLMALLEEILYLLQSIDWVAFGEWLVSSLFDSISSLILNMDWAGLIANILQIIMYALIAIVKVIFGILKEMFWDQLIKPLITVLAELWERLKTVLLTVANWFNDNVIQPVINFFSNLPKKISEFFSNLWEDICNIWNTVATWFNTNVIEPVVGFFSGLWHSVAGFFSNLWQGIKDVWHGAGTWFNEKVIQPVVGFFEGIWTSVSGFFSNLWEDIKSVWQGVADWFNEHVIKPIAGFFEGLWKGIKTVINAILGGIESFVNFFVDALNWIIRGINKISFDIPDWVPLVGGKKWGFNIKEVGKVALPRLAQGAVIPPNKEFLAVLGDQKSGTNIEAPLDTIKQAFMEVLQNTNGLNTSKEPIILQLNGRDIAKVVWDENDKKYKQTGRYAPAY